MVNEAIFPDSMWWETWQWSSHTPGLSAIMSTAFVLPGRSEPRNRRGDVDLRSPHETIERPGIDLQGRSELLVVTRRVEGGLHLNFDIFSTRVVASTASHQGRFIFPAFSRACRHMPATSLPPRLSAAKRQSRAPEWSDGKLPQRSRRPAERCRG